MRSVWVNDCGLWFADEDGAPYLARGVLRAGAQPGGARPGRAGAARAAANSSSFWRARSPWRATTARATPSSCCRSTTCRWWPMRSGRRPSTRRKRRSSSACAIRSRVGDLAGHLSDSEIGIILRVGDEVEAAQAIERLVRALGDQMVSTDAGPIGPMVSAGVVMIPAGAASIEDCLARARAAQREARGRGAGHCVFHSLSRAGGRPKLAPCGRRRSPHARARRRQAGACPPAGGGARRRRVCRVP